METKLFQYNVNFKITTVQMSHLGVITGVITSGQMSHLGLWYYDDCTNVSSKSMVL